MPELSRRRVLALGGGALGSLLAGRAHALGPGSQLGVAEIMVPGATVSRPAAWERLLLEVDQSTSIVTNPTPVQLQPEDPELFRHPFSVLTLQAPLGDLGDVARQQLARYLAYGGFLLVDDTSGAPGGPIHSSVKALVRTLFPTRPLAPLAADHSIYRSFFLIERPLGRVAASERLEGVTTGPTTPLVYCANDLSGAYDRLPSGADAHACIPGGDWQRLEAIKLGINLAMYSLTSNYKHDQAHVLELIREGRLE